MAVRGTLGKVVPSPAWLALVALAGCAPHPAAPRTLPELVLDIADPIIAAQVGTMVLRLRVDLDRRNTVELNPAAAARLALPFEPGMALMVGRVALTERDAAAPVTFAGVTVPLTLSTYDRDCCAGADGAIGPDLLPYDRVRFVRRGVIGGGETGSGEAGGSETELRLPLVRSVETGLSAVASTAAGNVSVGFSLGQANTVATAAAGAILARAQGGHYVSGGFAVPAAFGVMRPARRIAFDRPPLLAGFRITDVPVRTGDFRGGNALPEETAQDGEIVVRRRQRAQAAWPAILIGRDRLDRCGEILFRREPLALTLRCAFDAAAG